MDITSEQVAAYLPMVEMMARRMQGALGIEYDELVQEGLIDVWLTLKAGKTPSTDNVKHRMIDAKRYLTRTYPCDYEDILPLTYAENRHDRFL